MQTNRNLTLAGAAVVAVVGLATGLFIWPNYREAAAIQREIDELRSKIASMDGQAQIVDDLRAQLAAAQDHVARELKNIPDSPDLAGLIRKLSQEVDRVAVLDQTFTAGGPCDAIAGGTPRSNAQAMLLTVDMESTFDSVFALIRNAESLNRLVRVTSLHALCKRDEKQPTPIVKASIGLEVIYQPDAAASLPGATSSEAASGGRDRAASQRRPAPPTATAAATEQEGQ